MKAENTLQIMMDFQGDLCYTRQKCLDHLFCTVGNGYEWRDGELVEIDEDERLKRYKLVEDIKHAEPAKMIEKFGLEHERMVEMKILSKASTNPKMLNLLPPKWYPISEKYSYICNYPKDIKPDWLALINECKDMLKADGIEVPKNTPYKYK